MSRNKGVTHARIPHSFNQEDKKASFTWSLMLKLWNNMTMKWNDVAQTVEYYPNSQDHDEQSRKQKYEYWY